jgi:hypothetical protein
MYYRSIRSPYYKRAYGHSLHSMIFQVDLLQYLVPVMLLHLLPRRRLTLLPFILREHRDMPVGHICVHPFVERLQYQSREAIHAPDFESHDRKPSLPYGLGSSFIDTLHLPRQYTLWLFTLYLGWPVASIYITVSHSWRAHHWNVKSDLSHPEQL